MTCGTEGSIWVWMLWNLNSIASCILGKGTVKFILEEATKVQRGRWPMPRPGRFTPGKDPVPIVWVGPRARLDSAENLAPTGIQSLDRPACSESLYRLSYPDP